MSEICPYCGTRSPGKVSCRDCGGILDDLSEMATQIAMGPWYFHVTGKPWAPGCSLAVLQRMMKAGKIRPGSPVRGPATGQLWQRAENIPGLAHHTGRCHECFADVDAGSNSCFGCGTVFANLSDDTKDNNRNNNNNRLGVKDGSASAVAELVQNQRKIDPHTCPRCGSHIESTTCCDHCDAIFEPIAEATPMTLGPWFYRSNATAFFPGISLERLLELINVGTVTSQTIIRSPTTQQFWALAKTVEGIAHHVGFCHACEAEVDAHSKSCKVCGTTFADPPSGDQLGLRYQTDEDRDAAQKQLDEKLKEIAASQPTPQHVAPAAQSFTSRSAQSEYELYDDDVSDDDYLEDHHHEPLEHYEQYEEHHEDGTDVLDEIANARQRRPRKSDHLAGHLESITSDSHAEASYPDHDQDHDSVDPIHIEPGHKPAITPKAISNVTAAHAPAGLTADMAGQTAPAATDAKVRRQKSQLQQNQTKLATAALISVLMLIGVVVLIVASSGKPDNTDPGKDTLAKDTTNGAKDTTKYASQGMIDLRKAAEERWKTYSTVQQSKAFGPLVADARTNMVAARDLYGKQAYDDAEQSYQSASKAMDDIESLLRQQQAAQHASRRALAAQNTAKEFDVEAMAADLWAEAGELFKLAETAMRNEQFANATESFDKAIAKLGKATLFVQHMREANDARASIAAEIKKRYDDQALAKYGGEPWQRISNIMKNGDAFAAKKQFGLAMESFSKVRPIFPQLDIVIRRGLGRRFYAYRTGRVTAELIALKWKGTAISDEQFAALKQLYADLQLPPTLAIGLPTAADVTPTELDKWLRGKTMEQLAESFPGDDGKAVLTSYHIGVNFSIVEQLLNTELGPLNLRTKNEIRTTLKRLRPLLAEAGWDRQVTGMLDGFEATLIEEKEGSDRIRDAWRDLVRLIDEFDTGNLLIRADS